ncbi:MAG: chromosome segregation ATPase [Stigonema ocellatum SAG 48.90 = DSM 106950]|nr:chromosome segregation ATPase [Stigonema ocellatum SAG 48.90 = DSM 106950]
MTERDIPENWSAGRPREPDNMTILSRSQHKIEPDSSGALATGSTSKSVKQSKQGNSEPLPLNSQSQENPAPSRNYGKLPGWMKSWALWVFLLTLVPGGIAFMSTTMLLKLPSAPNCPSIFWPLASASVRLHCAQLAASKQTVTDLLQAIDLVKDLPKNHPLRTQIDHFLDQWSQDILQLADQSFQSGKLDEAIATARKIPQDTSTYKVVDEKITKWESTSSKAEDIYQQVEAEISAEHWHQAFMLTSKLLRLNSKYWAGTKYDELNQLIITSREDGEKLEKAESLAKSGIVDDLLKAIKLAESIGLGSYLHPKAEKVLPEFGRKMLEVAQTKLDRQDADAAISIAQKIPVNTGLQSETDDFISLAEAQRSAWMGTIAGLESAIAQAQQIDSTRPRYEKAQKLIARWQLEIEDVAHLEKARSLSSGGDIPALTAAISEAQVIPATNPRAKEARREINHWVAQIQTIEDQPYLDRAEQLALVDDMNALQAAIAEASQIRRGRALYKDAQSKIATWIEKVQRIQDQPYLDQARELARNGDIPAAIAVAQQIPSRRALSGEAQGAIDDWRGQIRARENWQKAREVALAGTPDALAEAIRIGNRVPNSSLLRNDVNVALDQWSQQLLDIARSQGESDMVKGIETAKLIPRNTAAYSAARDQIRTWRAILNPPPPPPATFDPPNTSEGDRE